MFQKQGLSSPPPSSSSSSPPASKTSITTFREALKIVEADIHHANSLAVDVQRITGGGCIQMRLSYSSLAPILFFLIRVMDVGSFGCNIYNLPSYLGLIEVLVYKIYVDGKSSVSSYERKAGLREFYGVIYPSLQQLESSSIETEEDVKTKEFWKSRDLEREDECGICMEIGSKMVLPSCNHSLCINCYHDWNTRSQSCPFCRGSLKKVASRDLWVLTDGADVLDSMTLLKENLKQFYLYINKLPLAIPESVFVGYYEYLI